MSDSFICPLCGESLYYVLHVHAERHGMTLEEYVKKYPKAGLRLVGNKKTWKKQKGKKNENT